MTREEYQERIRFYELMLKKGGIDLPRFAVVIFGLTMRYLKTGGHSEALSGH